MSFVCMAHHDGFSVLAAQSSARLASLEYMKGMEGMKDMKKSVGSISLPVWLAALASLTVLTAGNSTVCFSTDGTRRRSQAGGRGVSRAVHARRLHGGASAAAGYVSAQTAHREAVYLRRQSRHGLRRQAQDPWHLRADDDHRWRDRVPDHPYYQVGGTVRAREWSAWHIEVSNPKQTYWLNHYPKVVAHDLQRKTSRRRFLSPAARRSSSVSSTGTTARSTTASRDGLTVSRSSMASSTSHSRDRCCGWTSCRSAPSRRRKVRAPSPRHSPAAASVAPGRD